MPSFRQLATLLAATVATVAEAAPSSSTHGKRQTTALPSYALTYAPVAYLYSGESYWPSDVATHLQNVIVENNFSPVSPWTTAGSVTLSNLNSVPSGDYLTSAQNAAASTLPSWLYSTYGKPTSTTSGSSAAPGTIVAVQKNSTWVDVFYFYFYSYNYGGKVLDINFDDHVGDWEHTMIRFVNGAPYAMYYSQHGAGSAYYWSVLNKQGDRPINYVATGSHANYAKPGTEEYTIAFGIVTDTTDAGYAWDFTQNYRGYWYDTSSGSFTEAGGAGTGGSEEGAGGGSTEGASWLQWQGTWGDEQYPDSTSGQYCIFGECHYTSGPTGPVAKNLGRQAMCENESSCTIFDNIDDLTHQSKKREAEQ